MNFTSEIIDHQATALFTMLKTELQILQSNTYVEPFAWYNGRERWVGLIVRRNYGPSKNMVVIFGEARNSDMLCVEHWLQSTSINPPTVERSDRTDATYQARKYFDPWGIKEAFKHIQSLVTDYECQPRKE